MAEINLVMNKKQTKPPTGYIFVIVDIVPIRISKIFTSLSKQNTMKIIEWIVFIDSS